MHRKSTLLILLAVLVLGAVCVGPPPASFTRDLAPSVQRVERLLHTIGTLFGQP